MDRALFGDDPLIVFITICCFLVFNFKFYFLQRCCTKVVPLYVTGATLLQICQKLLTTLCKICYRGSEDIDNLLTNLLWGVRGYWQPYNKFFRGYWQILQRGRICERVANTLWSFAKTVGRGYWRHFQECCSIYLHVLLVARLSLVR